MVHFGLNYLKGGERVTCSVYNLKFYTLTNFYPIRKIEKIEDKKSQILPIKKKDRKKNNKKINGFLECGL